MSEMLTFTIDKFTFKVLADRYYHPEGVWAQDEGEGRVRVGLSDFAQQTNGDVAFADVDPEGTEVDFDDEIFTIETMKVDIMLPAPASGTLVAVNPILDTAPEAINQDPYGEGWLAIIQAEDWEAERAKLLDPHAYLALVKVEAEEALKEL